MDEFFYLTSYILSEEPGMIDMIKPLMKKYQGPELIKAAETQANHIWEQAALDEDTDLLANSFEEKDKQVGTELVRGAVLGEESLRALKIIQPETTPTSQSFAAFDMNIDEAHMKIHQNQANDRKDAEAEKMFLSYSSNTNPAEGIVKKTDFTLLLLIIGIWIRAETIESLTMPAIFSF